MIYTVFIAFTAPVSIARGSIPITVKLTHYHDYSCNNHGYFYRDYLVSPVISDGYPRRTTYHGYYTSSYYAVRKPMAV